MPGLPEAAAWELFMEIRRAEEKEGQSRRRDNRRSRDELLDLRRVSRGHHRPQAIRRRRDGATVH
jgi:hypothetical protein